MLLAAFYGLRQESKADLQAVETRLRADLPEFKTEERADIAELRVDSGALSEKLDRVLENLLQP